MDNIELKDDPKVGELKFLRNSELLDKGESYACSPDCSDPGTGSNDCTCEDK